MKKLISVLLILTMLLSLCACGATPEEKLIGQWRRVSENRNIFASYLEFFDNGTYNGGNFTITGNRIRFQKNWGEILVFDYELKGDKLTLYEGGSIYAVYERYIPKN